MERSPKANPPGFQPKHLLGLVKVILDKSKYFIDHLERLAASSEEFAVDELTINLSFDVIGEFSTLRCGRTSISGWRTNRMSGIVTFDMDLNAQIPGQQSSLLTTYRDLSHAYVKRDGSKHWIRRYFTENERQIRSLDNKLDAILKENIKKEHQKLLRGDASASRSVAALSLDGIEKLTPEILQQTSDTCRGFLFAGHDTTSILMQWIFYELHRSPHALKALTEELDEIFGPDTNPSTVMEKLLAPGNGELMGRLKCALLLSTLEKYTRRTNPAIIRYRCSHQRDTTTISPRNHSPTRARRLRDHLNHARRETLSSRRPSPDSKSLRHPARPLYLWRKQRRLRS